MKKLIYFISICSLNLTMPIWAASVDPVYQLFNDESDRMIIPVIPMTLDPISLGFDVQMSKNMDAQLQPTPVVAALSEGVDEWAINRLTAPAQPSHIASYSKETSKYIQIRVPTKEIFNKENQLSEKGKGIVSGIGKLIAQHPNTPVSILVKGKKPKLAEARAKSLSTDFQSLLMKGPEEFIINHQSDSTEMVIVDVWKGKP